MKICLTVFILLFRRSNTLGTGSDSEDEPLVVDDEDSTPPPCITINEDDAQQPIQIRVAVQGRRSSEEDAATTSSWTGIKDEFRMEMLEDEKKKQLVENINQYNHLLGNFINKMDVKNETMEKTYKKEQREFGNHQQQLLTKVRFIMIFRILIFV